MMDDLLSTQREMSKYRNSMGEKYTISEQQRRILYGELCRYCKKPSVYTHSSTIYGFQFGKDYGYIRWCKECDASVGVHEGTEIAYGSLAKRGLKKLRNETHKVFDVIWKKKGHTRIEAYLWLSIQLHIPVEFTHISMFNEDTCNEVIRLSKQYAQDLDDLDKHLVGEITGEDWNNGEFYKR